MSLSQLSEKLLKIKNRIPNVRGRGEEATKQTLVLPFLAALGYDIFHPDEVCPEYDADLAIKKQGQKERVDLAIVLDGQPRIFMEVKAIDVTLDGHQGQLQRYANSVSSVALGVLTNGCDYQFFTDTNKPNLLDKKPFFSFSLEDNFVPLETIQRFSKSLYSPSETRDHALKLLYISKMTTAFRREIDLRSREPSDSLTRWILSTDRIHEGRLTSSVVDYFRPIVKTSLRTVLQDVVRRSVAALDDEISAPQKDPETPSRPSESTAESPNKQDTKPITGTDTPAANAHEITPKKKKAVIVTTEAELTAFAIVKEQFERSSLAAETLFDKTKRKKVPIDCIYKDTSAYFSICFNKPTWWFARLNAEGRQPWIGVNLDAEAATSLLPSGFTLLPPSAFAKVRIAIDSVQDLHALNQVLFGAMQHVVAERNHS